MMVPESQADLAASPNALRPLPQAPRAPSSSPGGALNLEGTQLKLCASVPKTDRRPLGRRMISVTAAGLCLLYGAREKDGRGGRELC